VHERDDDAFSPKKEAFPFFSPGQGRNDEGKAAMTIRTASVYEPPADDEGLRVLIMRYWPRGVRRERVDVWLKDAAPSTELLRAYTHAGLSWDDFAHDYREEIHERPEVLEQLRDLEREHGTLTLLCHERIPPQEHCHREILQALLGQGAPRRASRKASP
jgi:uncharacterized protein YeaO (DUF488 family)